MLEVVFYKENGITKVKGIIKDKTGNKKIVNISSEDALKIIEEAKNANGIDNIINKLNYYGNNMSFICDGAKIILQNRNDFIHDDNFKFIFDYARKKNYKISRKNEIKKGVITILSVGLIISTGVIVKSVLPEKKEPVFEDVPVTYTLPDYKPNLDRTEQMIDITEEETKEIPSLPKSLEEKIVVNKNLFGKAEQTTKNEVTNVEEIEKTTVKEAKKQQYEETITKKEVPTKKQNETTTRIENERLTTALNEVTTNESKVEDKTVPIIYIEGDEPYTKGFGSTDTKVYLDDIDVGTLSDSERVTTVKQNYGSIIKKYCDIYNLDYEIMCAVAAQERGVHSTTRDADGAIGLMQIQATVWSNPNDYFVTHNYATGEDEKIYPGSLSLGDLDTNIKVACGIMRMHLDNNSQNQIIALQGYNMGEGSIASILNRYSNNSGKSIEEIKLNPSDTGWIQYTSNYSGDPNYVSNVMRYYGGDKYLTASQLRR